MVSAERAGDFATAPDDHGAPQMPDPNAGLPPRYLRTAEAARFLGLSPRTLENTAFTAPVRLSQNRRSRRLRGCRSERMG